MATGTSDAAPIEIGIVGTGWRTGFFRRALTALGGGTVVRRLLAHSDASASRAAERWGVPATASFDDFARDRFDYVLVAVPRADAPALASALVRRNIPVLLETPPAADLDRLQALYRELGDDAPLQVAEQYRFQPQHAARLAVAQSGLLGAVTSASVSVAHDYHAMSLLRAFLKVGFGPVEIVASRSVDRLARSLDSTGWASDEARVERERTIAHLRFEGDRLGVYDFEDEQYFSPIRSRHLAVRGERGEVVDDTVHLLRGPGEPVTLPLVRRQTGVDGDLEGFFLDRVTLGSDVVYRNPFPGARLSDDEIAVATVCARMAAFVRDGTPGYGLADAAQDAYLALLIHQAAASGARLVSTDQPWSDAESLLA